jgi:hypothetical protein
MSHEVSRIGVAAAKAQLNHKPDEVVRLLHELHRVGQEAVESARPQRQLHLVADEREWEGDDPDSEGGETE